MNDNRKKIYDKLSEHANVGTFEQFSNAMDNEDTRKNFFLKASENFDLGGYDQFNKFVAPPIKMNFPNRPLQKGEVAVYPEMTVTGKTSDARPLVQIPLTEAERKIGTNIPQQSVANAYEDERRRLGNALQVAGVVAPLEGIMSNVERPIAEGEKNIAQGLTTEVPASNMMGLITNPYASAQMLRGVARTTLGGVQTALGAMMPVAMYNAVSPAVQKVATETGIKLGYKPEDIQRVTDTLLPFVFSPGVGFGSAISKQSRKLLDPLMDKIGLEGEDKNLALDLIENGVFFGVAAKGDKLIDATKTAYGKNYLDVQDRVQNTNANWAKALTDYQNNPSKMGMKKAEYWYKKATQAKDDLKNLDDFYDTHGRFPTTKEIAQKTAESTVVKNQTLVDYLLGKIPFKSMPKEIQDEIPIQWRESGANEPIPLLKAGETKAPKTLSDALQQARQELENERLSNVRKAAIKPEQTTGKALYPPQPIERVSIKYDKDGNRIVEPTVGQTMPITGVTQEQFLKGEQNASLQKEVEEANKIPSEQGQPIVGGAERQTKEGTALRQGQNKITYRGASSLPEGVQNALAENDATLQKIFNLRETSRSKDSRPSEKRDANKQIGKLATELRSKGIDIKYDLTDKNIYVEGAKIFPTETNRRVKPEEVKIENETASTPFEQLLPEEVQKQVAMAHIVEPSDLGTGYGDKTIKKGLQDIKDDKGKEQSLEAQMVRDAALAKIETGVKVGDRQVKGDELVDMVSAGMGGNEYEVAKKNYDDLLNDAFATKEEVQAAKKKVEEAEKTSTPSKIVERGSSEQPLAETVTKRPESQTETPQQTVPEIPQDGKAFKISMPDGSEKIFSVPSNTHRQATVEAWSYLFNQLKQSGVDELEAGKRADDMVMASIAAGGTGDVVGGKFIPSETKAPEVPKSDKGEPFLSTEMSKSVFNIEKGLAENEGKGAEGTPLFEQKTEDKSQENLFSEKEKKRKEDYDAAKQDLKDKWNEGKKLTPSGLGGLDPFFHDLTAAKDVITIAKYHLDNIIQAGIEKGERVAEWMKRMVDEFGDNIKPHLKEVWDELNRVMPTLGKPENNLFNKISSMQSASFKERAEAKAGELGEYALNNASVAYETLKSAFRDLKELNPQKLWNKLDSTPKENNFVKVVRWNEGNKDITAYNILRLTREIMRVAPKELDQRAMGAVIEAGGDISTLQRWRDLSIKKAQDNAGAGKWKREDKRIVDKYEKAMDLDDEQLALAKYIHEYFNDKFSQLSQEGIVAHFIENYVDRQTVRKKDADKLQTRMMYGADHSGLSDNFAYAKKRIFDTIFDVEQSKEFKVVSDNILTNLASYIESADRALSNKKSLEALLHTTVGDNEPLFRPAGIGIPVKAKNGFWETATEAVLVKPDALPKEAMTKAGNRYEPVNIPSLKKWKFAGANEGYWELPSNVFVEADLLVHPDFAQKVKNWLSWGTKEGTYDVPVYNQLKWLNREVKGLIFFFNPFHAVQVGTHTIFHEVNPFKMTRFDPEDPLHRRIVYSGTKLYDYRAMDVSREGLTATGLATRLPIVGQMAEAIRDFTFEKQIPSYKINVWMAMREKNEKIYGGKKSQWEIDAMTSDQVNAAFGHLNYAALFRNPRAQEVLRFFVLAPDFMEARLRFLGQAFKRGGLNQFRALMVGAAGLYLTARVINKVVNDDWMFDPKMAFAVKIGGREWDLRSVPGDVMEAVATPWRFTYNRVAPYAKFFLELLSRTNYSGEMIQPSEATMDLIRTHMPSIVRGRMDMNWGQNLLSSLGLRNKQYRTSDEQSIAEDYSKFVIPRAYTAKTKDAMKFKSELNDMIKNKANADEIEKKFAEGIDLGYIEGKGKSFEEYLNKMGTDKSAFEFGRLPADQQKIRLEDMKDVRRYMPYINKKLLEDPEINKKANEILKELYNSENPEDEDLYFKLRDKLYSSEDEGNQPDPNEGIDWEQLLQNYYEKSNNEESLITSQLSLKDRIKSNRRSRVVSVQ